MASVRHNNSGNTHIRWYLVICRCFSETGSRHLRFQNGIWRQFLASVRHSGLRNTAILQFKMLSKVDLLLQCIITIPEILILGGIWSFAAVFQKPAAAILDFEMVFGDMPEEGCRNIMDMFVTPKNIYL